MHIMIIKIYNHTNMYMSFNFCMLGWSGENGEKSGKSQGILILCASGNPATRVVVA